MTPTRGQIESLVMRIQNAFPRLPDTLADAACGRAVVPRGRGTCAAVLDALVEAQVLTRRKAAMSDAFPRSPVAGPPRQKRRPPASESGGMRTQEAVMIEIRRILCPIDFSDYSRRALDHAIAIARWYESTVTALHVFSPAPVAAFGPARWSSSRLC